jgi:hypothetical protein
MLLAGAQLHLLWQGAHFAVYLYSQYGGANGSTIAVQIALEVLMLAVYLFARTLARRAFNGDPSAEAQALFTFIMISDAFAELAFINTELYSAEFWVLLLLDFTMLVMREADLWQDLADALKRMFGGRCGTICGVAMEIAAGETDLLAARVDTSVNSDNKAQSYKVQKKKMIVSRLVASQAVASEFIITGAFLSVTLAQFVLDMADANAHRRSILPTQPGTIVTGCDPCTCDLNGKVVGQWSPEAGGCAAREFDLVNAVGGNIKLLRRLCSRS